MPCRRLICSVMLALCLAAPVQAADCCLSLDEAVTPESAARIAGWTAAASGLPPARVLPTLAFRSGAALAAMRGGAGRLDPRDQVALYDPERHIIFLSTDWRGSRLAAESIVVHEMVHHLQREAGLRFNCLAEGEEQAYAAQDAWLMAGGTSLEREFGIDAFSRLAAGLCQY